MKNLPFDYINKFILRLVNLSQKDLPLAWKTASVTMIPKTDIKSDDPNNYRPISLTSCLGKLAERLIKMRLNQFLDKNRLIIEQQSGFRDKRGTTDNLLYVTQKISESFLRGKSVCGIFFDISKAFDKVWHDGLIYKLYYCLKIPTYLLVFIKNFLSNRLFKVKLNCESSHSKSIECGVPQGSVLGPLLFLIYINDIDIVQFKNKSFTTLYADDLGTFFIFKKLGNTEAIINCYLNKLMKWLSKWRLIMNAKKCVYTIFSNGNGKISLNLKLYNEIIPYNPNPLFLGIIFDECLCFNKHYEYLQERSLKRLNIIKIFSHKSWHLSHKTLCNIFKALIGSIFNYSFFTLANVSENSKNKLQRVQNRAIRCIFKMEWNCLNSELYKQSGILPINQRFIQLGCRYLTRALTHNNFIIDMTKEFLWSRSGLQRVGKKLTPIGTIFSYISISYAVLSWLFMSGFCISLFYKL